MHNQAQMSVKVDLTSKIPLDSAIQIFLHQGDRHILRRYLARVEQEKLLLGKRCTWGESSNRQV
ncbi:hypothetical protein [Microseira sp. BLCC-F43]|uniref:hypothetical protein n=1 Tax=Microseira sp. BLCC-F43 TaxID=3153602 RepID=UPI0035B8B235